MTAHEPLDTDWLPELICLPQFDGNWQRYIDAVYLVFRKDFVLSQPKLDGLWVHYRRDPIYDGKEAGFWHCTSEGKTEDERTPDLRRCERIGWVRAIIENAGVASIDRWQNTSRGEPRQLLWFREEFLIVLAARTRKRDGAKYWQLLTAYDTPQEHTKRKLRKERDAQSP